MVLTALGSGLLDAGTSLLGSIFGASSQASANRANMRLAKYQNEWNLEQWNRENEYNSPIRQMERLKAAGLNPNLVYGSGASAGSASSITSATPAPVQPVDYGSGIKDLGHIAQQYISNTMQQQHLDVEKQRSETERIKATASALRDQAEADLANEKSGAQSITNKYLEQTLKNQIRNDDIQYEIDKVEVELKKQGIELNKSDLAIKDIMSKKLSEELKMLPLQANLLISQAELNVANKLNAMSQANLNSLHSELLSASKEYKLEYEKAISEGAKSDAAIKLATSRYAEQKAFNEMQESGYNLETARKKSVHNSDVGASISDVLNLYYDSFEDFKRSFGRGDDNYKFTYRTH